MHQWRIPSCTVVLSQQEGFDLTKHNAFVQLWNSWDFFSFFFSSQQTPTYHGEAILSFNIPSVLLSTSTWTKDALVLGWTALVHLTQVAPTSALERISFRRPCQSPWICATKEREWRGSKTRQDSFLSCRNGWKWQEHREVRRSEIGEQRNDNCDFSNAIGGEDEQRKDNCDFNECLCAIGWKDVTTTTCGEANLRMPKPMDQMIQATMATHTVTQESSFDMRKFNLKKSRKKMI